MKKILIIKTGTTLPALAAKKGDYEDWIITGMGISYSNVIITDVTNGAQLPVLTDISGIIVTGSHAMVTEELEWSKKTEHYLQEASIPDIPILGICYGHQLLAHAFGGIVGNNQKGKEIGTVNVYLNGNAKNDVLFKNFKSPIKVQVSHTQTVMTLPENAELLAWSDDDLHQAFIIRKRIWGVQFHPEFDAEVVQENIKNSRNELLQGGKDPDLLLQTTHDTEYGKTILRRFRDFVEG